jgi:hypothetical protein
MPKDTKKKKEEKKARVYQKQEKKATKTEKKQSKKSKDEDSDAEDADLDAILAAYQKQQEQFLKVTEVTCDPPSPRKRAFICFGKMYSNTNRHRIIICPSSIPQQHQRTISLRRRVLQRRSGNFLQ